MRLDNNDIFYTICEREKKVLQRCIPRHYSYLCLNIFFDIISNLFFILLDYFLILIAIYVHLLLDELVGEQLISLASRKCSFCCHLIYSYSRVTLGKPPETPLQPYAPIQSQPPNPTPASSFKLYH